jgi:hypothetical protein
MYLKSFVNSILNLGNYDSSFRELGQNQSELHSVFEQNKYAYSQPPLSQFEGLVLQLCKEYISNAPSKGVAHACHAMCQGFNDIFDNSPHSEGGDLDISIGNVFYKDSNIYELTQNRLNSVMADGFQPNTELPLHVWLTLPNLTVVDLTIVPTLLDKGVELTFQEKEDKIILWKENEPSNFRYEPLLVDNSFMHRIDKIIKVV